MLRRAWLAFGFEKMNAEPEGFDGRRKGVSLENRERNQRSVQAVDKSSALPVRVLNSLGRLLTLVLIEFIPLMVGIHVHYALLHPVVPPFKIMKKFKTHFA